MERIVNTLCRVRGAALKLGQIVSIQGMCNRVVDNNNNNNYNNNSIERHNSRFLCNLLTAPQTISNSHALVTGVQSCANLVQPIERFSRATCHMPCGMKGQLRY